MSLRIPVAPHVNFLWLYACNYVHPCFGSQVRAIAPETESSTPEVAASSSIPAYVWPIVIFAIAGVLTSIFLAVLYLLEGVQEETIGVSVVLHAESHPNLPEPLPLSLQKIVGPVPC